MRSPGHRARLLAAVCCGWAVVVTGGSGAGAAPAAAGAAAATASACKARQLAGKVESSSGAAGTIVLRISLRNHGTACTLVGYPTLRLRRDTTPMPTRTVRGGLPLLESPADPVELAPNGRAFLLVAYSDMPPGKSRGTTSTTFSQCPGASAVDLWVAGWSRPVPVRALITACDGGKLRSSPFLHPAGSSSTATAPAPEAVPGLPGSL